MSVATTHSTVSMAELTDQAYRYFIRGNDVAPRQQLAKRLGTPPTSSISPSPPPPI